MVLTLKRKLKSEDLFSELNQEKEQHKDRQFETSQSKSLIDLIAGFERAMDTKVSHNFQNIYWGDWMLGNWEEFYQECLNQSINSTARDINQFCRFYIPMKLKGRKNEFDNLEARIGLFLSSLVNNSDDNEFLIELPNYRTGKSGIQFVGYKNQGKKITINGYTGEGIGMQMESGLIHVEDPVGIYHPKEAGRQMKGGKIIVDNTIEINHASDDELNNKPNWHIGKSMEGGEIEFYGRLINAGREMKKGNIRIYGNVRDEIGWHMQDGLIEVDGNVGKVGPHMCGGSIKVNGNAEEIGEEMYYGKIYVNGKQHGRVGYKMKGFGKIEVIGNIRGVPGLHMGGGTISITGKYFRLPESTNGNIYRNGKLVLKDGKRLV